MSTATDEAPRPDPGFRVLVVCRVGDPIDVTHAVCDVYDIAVNSMDFGSGFLSTEEVGHLRALGKAIGAQRFDYQHDKCLRCGQDFERHHYHYDTGRTTLEETGPRKVRAADYPDGVHLVACAGWIGVDGHTPEVAGDDS